MVSGYLSMEVGVSEEQIVPDPGILSRFVTAQNVLPSLSGRPLVEFVSETLQEIPGVSSAELSLSEPGIENTCELDGRNEWELFLDTGHGNYGSILLDVDDQAAFAPYRPFLAYFAASLALLIENRQQRRELESVLAEAGQSRQGYQRLFAEMSSAHAVHEVIVDEQGIPYDFRFIEVNPAFTQLTGIGAGDARGRRMRELLPGMEAEWVERCGRVAITGETIRFEDYDRDFGRHYEVIGYRPEAGQVAVIFTDITERKDMEERLRRASSEWRDFSLRLQDALVDIPEELAGVRFGHLYQSATEYARIGGDFYDVFRAKGGQIGLLIGDVAGHGIEAARVATLVKDSVRAFAHQFRRPHLVLRETNRLLDGRRFKGFATVFLGFLDPVTGGLVYSSGGHPPPVLAVSGSVDMLDLEGPPLGAFPDARYRDRRMVIPRGSLLVLYTDGLTEARRGKDHFRRRQARIAHRVVMGRARRKPARATARAGEALLCRPPTRRRRAAGRCVHGALEGVHRPAGLTL